MPDPANPTSSSASQTPDPRTGGSAPAPKASNGLVNTADGPKSPMANSTVFLGESNRSLTRIIETPSIPRQFWHMCQMIYFGARRVHLARMAAALSYRTIFGLIPVIVVGISVYANFAPDHAGQAVRDLLKFTNLNQIEEQDAQDPSLTDPMAPDMQDVGGSPPATPQPAPTASSSSGGPEATKLTKAEKIKLDKWIEELVARAKTVQFGAISIVGLLTLFYAAISMLVEIEKT